MRTRTRIPLLMTLLALIACALQGAEAPPVFDARSGFEQLRSLAGEWRGTAGAEGGESFDATVVYRVTAGGSAVVETEFPGTDHEMVTVYHLEGENLVLTHYCAYGNQPKMAFVASDTPGVLAFEFAGGSNIVPERDAHMHSGVLSFRGDGTFESRWQGYKDGQPEHEARFVLERKN